MIETGRLLGGDSAYMYIGTVRVDGGAVHVALTIKKYSNTGGMQSVFGPVNEFHLNLQAKIDPQRMVFTGHVVENPALKITVEAVRRAELP